MSLQRVARWLGGIGATSAAMLAWSSGAYGQGHGCKCEKCPPPFVHCIEGPPKLKFKCACPKPVCDPCMLPHYGYFQACWRPWTLPPDWNHCPVPPPAALVPLPPPQPYPPPPGLLPPGPTPGQTRPGALPAPKPVEPEGQTRRPLPAGPAPVQRSLAPSVTPTVLPQRAHQELPVIR